VAEKKRIKKRENKNKTINTNTCIQAMIRNTGLIKNRCDISALEG